MSKPLLTAKWPSRHLAVLGEYLLVLAMIAVVTLAGWFAPAPVSFHVVGQVYLLVVIVLCLQVGRWPVLFAAVVSALTWNFVFLPPRLSFSVLHFEDAILLGTYFVVALIAGQLTARIRSQEREERQREQQATALFHLTRALAGARTVSEAVEAALRQADALFHARTALVLTDPEGRLTPHAAGSFALNRDELKVAGWVWGNGREAGRFTDTFASAAGLHVPLVRAGQMIGVFIVCLPEGGVLRADRQHDLIEGFAAQIALLIEREQWRAASEREKLLAESDRLHRTLFDSVSHELKTPLAVLRSAAENLEPALGGQNAVLAGEILTATGRLERLVANLLNQSRLESGKIKVQPDWCDARDLIAAARRATGDALAGRLCRVQVAADLPLFRADAPLMEQVLANLLLNVARHTPPESPMVVEAGLEAGGARVFIAVADCGPGIPPEIRATLFQKFNRGPAAGAGGLGLGLSIVRGFMLAQGGEVMAEDNPGGGARFAVYLPCSTFHGNVPIE